MAVKKKVLSRRVSKLKRIEEKVEKLALLSKLSQILNSTLDQQEVRRRAMEAVTQLMKGEVGSLLLVDEEGELRLKIGVLRFLLHSVVELYRLDLGLDGDAENLERRQVAFACH